MEIQKCPNLKSLVSDHRKCWDDDSLHLFCKSDQAAFGRLEKLKIGGYDSISSLWCDQIPIDLFTGLVALTVSDCGNIKSLFSPSIATILVNLIKLSIQSCPKMEQVMLWNEEEVNGESSRITFPKLKELSLEDLPRLTSFCKGIQSIEFPLLSEMEIKKCPNLKRVVSSMENDHICSGAVNHDADDSLHLFCKSQVAFDRLELVIDGCDSISSLWCDQIPIGFCTGLVRLTVSNCGNIKSLFSPLINGNLVNLEYFRIKNCRENKVERSPFIKLEVLELNDLPKLKAFGDWSCALQLPSLKSLNISECPEMERLLSGSLTSPISSDSFKNLEIISIRDCSMLEQVMLWNEEEVNGESSRITFPKLRELTLHDLPRLTSFCKGIQSIEFPLLSDMEIEKCPNLKSLASSTENDHICFGAINHDSLHLFCKSQAAFGSLENLTIGGYENSISERSWSLCCDQIPVDSFTGLVALEVSNCGNIKSLFSASIAENLVNLERLYIVSCCEMVKVIEDEDEVERSPFIKLKQLHLIGLPKLKSFCDWRCALHLPSLQRVYISECPEMERFSFGSLTTPNLEEIIKNWEGISDYTNDLNDAVIWEWDRDSLHLDILFGSIE